MKAAIAAFVIAFGGFVVAQAPSQSPAAPAQPLKGTLDRVKVFGTSLEGNLMGETASPEVSIYLPPSYAKDRNKRYPVVYLLH
jgi:hypothetical protein